MSIRLSVFFFFRPVAQQCQQCLLHNSACCTTVPFHFLYSGALPFIAVSRIPSDNPCLLTVSYHNPTQKKEMESLAATKVKKTSFASCDTNQQLRLSCRWIWCCWSSDTLGACARDMCHQFRLSKTIGSLCNNCKRSQRRRKDVFHLKLHVLSNFKFHIYCHIPAAFLELMFF